MEELKQKLYQIVCGCGCYEWIKKVKPNQDKYICIKCKITFAATDKDRNRYVIRDRMVFKKRGVQK